MEPDSSGVWYHGSNCDFSLLREWSTVTRWRALAEAFSHKPTCLEYDDDGTIRHNGIETGYLYILDETVTVGEDLVPHPRTAMDPGVE